MYARTSHSHTLSTYFNNVVINEEISSLEVWNMFFLFLSDLNLNYPMAIRHILFVELSGQFVDYEKCARSEKCEWFD